jgi:hypothetical protein
VLQRILVRQRVELRQRYLPAATAAVQQHVHAELGLPDDHLHVWRWLAVQLPTVHQRLLRDDHGRVSCEQRGLGRHLHVQL